MDISDIKRQAVERIYLFPGEHDGETTLLWGDDPAPSEGMVASEAVEYVRKDVHDARIAELEQQRDQCRAYSKELNTAYERLINKCAATENERDQYRAAEEAQIALRQKMEGERDALAAHVERLREGLHQALIHWGESCTDEDGTAYAECEKRCDETPVTSLARRDALKQAEVLEQVFKRWMHRATAEEILREINFMIQNRRREIETQQ